MMIHRSTHVLASLGFLALTVGCDALPEPSIIPAVLPGSKPVAVISEADAAQALGEGAGSTTVQPPMPESSDVTLPPLAATPIGESRTTGTKLEYTTLKAGTGPQAKPNQRATVHYVGTLPNGVKFDSSRDRDAPFTFKIGGREVIRGWEEGVTGMNVGETRKLTIPSSLAYGPNGRPPTIPPNATLIFEIELLKIE